MLVWIRRLDRVSARVVLEDGPAGPVAKHAVAGHLEVDDVLGAVFEGDGEDPFYAFVFAGKALEGLAGGGPDGGFVGAVPV